MLQVDEKNDKCLVKWGTDSETWANTKDVLKGKYSRDQICGNTLRIYTERPPVQLRPRYHPCRLAPPPKIYSFGDIASTHDQCEHAFKASPTANAISTTKSISNENALAHREWFDSIFAFVFSQYECVFRLVVE